jgi:4-hydroxythreonine-4-phosphate dehydrogenase
MSIKTAFRESGLRAIARDGRPVIAVTMGEAGGIGPEVTLKALARTSVRKACRPVVIGDLRFLRALVRDLRIPVGLRGTRVFGEASGEAIGVYDVARLSGKPPLGEPSLRAGRAAGKAVEQAVRMVLLGEAAGVVTAPVSKESFARAGYGMVGHTEILARLTGTRYCAMMLTNGRLRVIFASTHVPHRKAAAKLTRAGLLRKLRIANEYLGLYMGIPDARIGVACLNPHCGESGRLGREEKDVIIPVVEAAQQEGICVEGPFAADSIYRPTIADRFDAIIAMYHDQGMIPLKLKGHGDVVNVTLGIPVVRTSPGHGTAFDIAGTGRAAAGSMVMAILECVRIVKRLDHAC